MSVSFHSPLAGDLRDFVVAKRALGRKYDWAELRLQSLDRELALDAAEHDGQVCLKRASIAGCPSTPLGTASSPLTRSWPGSFACSGSDATVTAGFPSLASSGGRTDFVRTSSRLARSAASCARSRAFVDRTHRYGAPPSRRWCSSCTAPASAPVSPFA